MGDATLINYTTRDFVSKTELELYISKQDSIFTDDVIPIFKRAGMLRRVVTKIWNREGTFRVRILFEYTEEKAFKDCQKMLKKYYIGHLKYFNSKVVGSRGIVVHEFLRFNLLN